MTRTAKWIRVVDSRLEVCAGDVVGVEICEGIRVVVLGGWDAVG
jgi:hypothetical protein